MSRLFADLGADVLKIEPPGGSPARRTSPRVAASASRSRWTTPTSASRCLIRTDAADRDRLIELAGDADIVVDGGDPGGAAAFGTSCAALADRFAHLVALSVTDFGTAGPHAPWRATDAVLYAMSTALSRTGSDNRDTRCCRLTESPRRRPQCRPRGRRWSPTTIDCVAAEENTSTSPGSRRSFSRSIRRSAPRGRRPSARSSPPSCGAAGRAISRSTRHFRARTATSGSVCCRSRQWRGMRAWLGEPEQFAGPKFETIAARYAASAELNAAIADLFAPQTMGALVDAGAGARGSHRGGPDTRQRRCPPSTFGIVGALTDTADRAGGHRHGAGRRPR